MIVNSNSLRAEWVVGGTVGWYLVEQLTQHQHVRVALLLLLATCLHTGITGDRMVNTQIIETILRRGYEEETPAPTDCLWSCICPPTGRVMVIAWVTHLELVCALLVQRVVPVRPVGRRREGRSDVAVAGGVLPAVTLGVRRQWLPALTLHQLWRERVTAMETSAHDECPHSGSRCSEKASSCKGTGFIVVRG